MKNIFIVVGFCMALTACSNGSVSSGALSWLNGIANFKLLEKQDPEVQKLFNKYKPLLNELEVALSLQAYNSIKLAANDPNIKTPLRLIQAKTAYLKVVPLYTKYKEQIEQPDQVTITEIHLKLKSISNIIDDAIEQTVKDKMTLEYIKTAAVLIQAFN